MLSQASLVAFVPSRDLERARPFYEGVLGLKLKHHDGFALIFDAHGTALRVTAVPKLEPHPFTVLGWHVDDIASRVRSLQAKGVRFEHFAGVAVDALGIWTAPGGARVAWFKDPDGNLLSLTQT